MFRQTNTTVLSVWHAHPTMDEGGHRADSHTQWRNKRPRQPREGRGAVGTQGVGILKIRSKSWQINRPTQQRLSSKTLSRGGKIPPGGGKKKWGAKKKKRKGPHKRVNESLIGGGKLMGDFASFHHWPYWSNKMKYQLRIHPTVLFDCKFGIWIEMTAFIFSAIVAGNSQTLSTRELQSVNLTILLRS